MLRSETRLGARVEREQRLAVISDPLGTIEEEVRAPAAGIVIALTRLPLVNEGDALFHLAIFDRPGRVAAQVEAFQASLEPAAPGEALEPPESAA
jgi:predicted deacylase